jgi:predicted transcriptional regulator
MYEIKSMMAIKVLYKLIERSSFNVGEVSLSVKDRAEICSELDTNTAVISRALRQLLDLNVISGEKGKYKINPEIF